MSLHTSSGVDSVLSDAAENAPVEPLDALLKQIVEGYFVLTDGQGSVSKWSEPAELLFGRDAQDVLGQSFFEGLLAGPLSPDAEAWRRFLAAGDPPTAPGRVTVQARRDNGERFPMEAVFVPVKLDEGFDFSLFLEDLGFELPLNLMLLRMRQQHPVVVRALRSAIEPEPQPWEGWRTAGTLVVFRPLEPTPWVQEELEAREAARAEADAATEEAITNPDPGIQGNSVNDLDDAAAVVARLLSAMERIDDLERMAGALPAQVQEARKDAESSRSRAEAAEREASRLREDLRRAIDEIKAGGNDSQHLELLARMERLERARMDDDDARATALRAAEAARTELSARLDRAEAERARAVELIEARVADAVAEAQRRAEEAMDEARSRAEGAKSAFESRILNLEQLKGGGPAEADLAAQLERVRAEHEEAVQAARHELAETLEGIERERERDAEAAGAELRAALERIEHVQRESDALREQLTQITVERHEAEGLAGEERRRLADLQREAEQTRARIDALREGEDALRAESREELAELRAELAELRSAADFTAVADELRAELDARGALTELRTRQEELDAALREQSEQIMGGGDAAERAAAEVERLGREQAARLEEIERAQDRLAEANLDILRSQEDFARRHEEVAQAQAEIVRRGDELQAELERARTDAGARDDEALAALAGRTDGLAAAQAELERAQRELAARADELTAAQAEFDQAGDEILARAGEIAAGQAELIRRTDELGASRDELAARAEEALAVARRAEEAAAAQAETARRTEALAARTEELAARTDELRDLASRADEVGAALADIARRQDAAEATAAELGAAQRRVAAEHAELREWVEAARAERDQFRATTEHALSQLAEVRAALQEHESSISVQIPSNAVEHEELLRVTGEVRGEIASAVGHARTEIAALRDAEEALRARVESLFAAGERADERLAQLEAAAARIEGVEGLHGDVAGLAGRVDHAASEIAGLAGRVDAVEGAAGSLGGLASRLEEAAAEVAGLAGRVDAVEGASSHVADLAARVDAVEGAAAGVAELTRRVESAEGLSERLEAVEHASSAIDALGARIEAMHSVTAAIDRLADRVAGVESLSGRVEAVEGLAGRVESVEGLAERVAAVEGLAGLSARAEAVEALADRADGLTRRLEAVEAAGPASQEELAALREQAAEAHRAAAGAASAREELAERFARASGELTELREQARAALNEARDAAERVNEIDRGAGNVLADVRAARDRIDEVVTLARTAQESADAGRVETNELRVALARLTGELQVARGELERAGEESLGAREQAVTAQQAASAAREDAGRAREDAAAVRREVESGRERLGVLSAGVERLGETVGHAAQAAESAQAEATAARRTGKELTQLVADLDAKANALRAEMGAGRDRLQAIDAAVDRISGSAASAGEQAADARRQGAELRAELAEVRAIAEQAAAGIDAVRAEVHTVRGAAEKIAADAQANTQTVRAGAERLEAMGAEVTFVLKSLDEIKAGLTSAGQAAVIARRDAEQAKKAAQTVGEGSKDNVTEVFAQLLGLAQKKSGGNSGIQRFPTTPPAKKERAKREPRHGFDDVAQPMAVLGLDGKFRELNPAFAKLVGYQEQEFSKAAWPSPHDRSVYKQQLEELTQLASGEIESVTVQSTYMHGQGLMVPVIGNLKAVPGPDGLPLHLLLEAEDRHHH